MTDSTRPIHPADSTDTPCAAATGRKADVAAAQGNILAIASGKGGVGKTWCSLTLAHVLARGGANVLVIDGDIGLANIDVQLGLLPEQDLSAVFSGHKTLSDIIVPYAPGGFDVVAGRSGSASLASLPLSRLQTLRAALAEVAPRYHYVLLDLGAGIEQHVQFLAALAQRCVVVTTDEPTALTDAYALIKLCHRHAPHLRMGFIVNMATTHKEGRKTTEALQRTCAHFLQREVPCLGVVRRDNRVRDAIKAQRLLIAHDSRSVAAVDMANISLNIMRNF